MSLLVLSIAWASLAIGHHFMSDIIVGSVIGLATALLVATITLR
jgi:membrane-associated phospholipid phosphatase